MQNDLCSVFTFGIRFSCYNESTEAPSNEIFQQILGSLADFSPDYVGRTEDKQNWVILWNDPKYDMNGFDSMMNDVMKHLFVKEGDMLRKLTDMGYLSWCVFISESEEGLRLDQFDFSLLTSLGVGIEVVREASYKRMLGRFTPFSGGIVAPHRDEYAVLRASRAFKEYLVLLKACKDIETADLISYYIKSARNSVTHAISSSYDLWGAFPSFENELKTLRKETDEEISRIEKLPGFPNSAIRKLLYPTGISTLFLVTKDCKSPFIFFKSYLGNNVEFRYSIAQYNDLGEYEINLSTRPGALQNALSVEQIDGHYVIPLTESQLNIRFFRLDHMLLDVVHWS